MVPLQLLRENKNTIIESLKKRGFDYKPAIDRVLKLDLQRRRNEKKFNSLKDLEKQLVIDKKLCEDLIK